MTAGTTLWPSAATSTQRQRKPLGSRPPLKSDIDIWDYFKLTWREHREDIAAYLQLLRDDKATLLDSGVGILDFMVPVELLLPSDPDDE